jgi:hypothetical protein
MPRRGFPWRNSHWHNHQAREEAGKAQVLAIRARALIDVERAEETNDQTALAAAKKVVREAQLVIQQNGWDDEGEPNRG